MFEATNFGTDLLHRSLFYMLFLLVSDAKFRFNVISSKMLVVAELFLKKIEKGFTYIGILVSAMEHCFNKRTTRV